MKIVYFLRTFLHDFFDKDREHERNCQTACLSRGAVTYYRFALSQEYEVFFDCGKLNELQLLKKFKWEED
jgi:hypothetical protein